MKFKYTPIRPKLWEVTGKNGTTLGRIRHVFSSKGETKLGWQASDGSIYPKAEQAAYALLEYRKRELERV